MYLFSGSLQEKVLYPNNGINQEREWHGDWHRKGINKMTKKASPNITGAKASLENIVQAGEGRRMAQGGLSKTDQEGQAFWKKNADSL